MRIPVCCELWLPLVLRIGRRGVFFFLFYTYSPFPRVFRALVFFFARSASRARAKRISLSPASIPCPQRHAPPAAFASCASCRVVCGQGARAGYVRVVGLGAGWGKEMPLKRWLPASWAGRAGAALGLKKGCPERPS